MEVKQEVRLMVSSFMCAGCAMRMAAWLLVVPGFAVAQQIAIGEFPVPTNKCLPAGIAAGADGALCFTEYSTGTIGRMSAAGTITEYVTPTSYSTPGAITAGPDGALAFTE